MYFSCTYSSPHKRRVCKYLLLNSNFCYRAVVANELNSFSYLARVGVQIHCWRKEGVREDQLATNIDDTLVIEYSRSQAHIKKTKASIWSQWKIMYSCYIVWRDHCCYDKVTFWRQIQASYVERMSIMVLWSYVMMIMCVCLLLVGFKLREKQSMLTMVSI